MKSDSDFKKVFHLLFDSIDPTEYKKLCASNDERMINNNKRKKTNFIF